MQRLARRRLLQQDGGLSRDAGDPAAAAPRVHRIADHRVANMLQMDANLVGTAGVQLQPEKVDDLEACHYGRVRAGAAAFG
jgi:hypothetical protein